MPAAHIQISIKVCSLRLPGTASKTKSPTAQTHPMVTLVAVVFSGSDYSSSSIMYSLRAPYLPMSSSGFVSWSMLAGSSDNWSVWWT